MNAPYVRFELAFDGEEQQVGFLTGLEDTGMDAEEVEELLEPFNQNMKVPPYRDWQSDSEHFPGAYFTKVGYLKYKDAINRIIEAVTYRKNGWAVIEIQSHSFPESYLYYEDEEQAVIRTYYAEEMELV